MFLVYFNNIQTISNSAHFTLYSDVIFVVVSNSYSLQFNAKGTRYLNFHRVEKIINKLSLSLDNIKIINMKNVLKFLGM